MISFGGLRKDTQRDFSRNNPNNTDFNKTGMAGQKRHHCSLIVPATLYFDISGAGLFISAPGAS
jgi:hypothetical protein